jgi:hypothetical protein
VRHGPDNCLSALVHRDVFAARSCATAGLPHGAWSVGGAGRAVELP